MLNFQLSGEQRMIRDLARDFAEKEIKPLAEEYDQSGEFPWPVVREAQEAELLNLNVPEEYGGPGLSVLEECIVNEELAYACSGIQTALMLNSLAAWPIILAGDEEQKEKYLTRLTEDGQMAAYGLTEPDAGSDVAGIKARAVRQGDDYVLNGSKTWITNSPVADFYIVFAKTDPDARHKGISCFLVDRDSEGLTVGDPVDVSVKEAVQAEGSTGLEGISGIETAVHRNPTYQSLTPLYPAFRKPTPLPVNNTSRQEQKNSSSG